MSRWLSAMVGVIALTALGAAAYPMAPGDAIGFSNASAAPRADVNRAAKSDRAATALRAGPQATRVYQLAGFPAVSIAARESQPATPPMLRETPGPGIAACEAVVSVLTGIADRLAPGRCVT